MFSPVPENLHAHPSVFAIRNRYQIIVPLCCPAVVKVRVGDRVFCDEYNGILRSNSHIHMVELPMKLLDEAKEYTLIYRKVIERKPYYPIMEDPVELTYKFKPVSGDKINIYHISDTHNMVTPPIQAGRYFGEDLDLLVMNGDIVNYLDGPEKFNNLYKIVSGVTGGMRPAVFSRGNHDTRGILAEQFADFTPGDNRKPYYTFRLGPLWGMVIDCGEDKDDTHPSYNDTVCFRAYNQRVDDFIHEVVENADTEYNAEGIKHKIVISHIPFTKIMNPNFKWLDPFLKEWSRVVAEEVKPELILYGHTHKCGVYGPNSEYDGFGLLKCTAVIASQPITKEKRFIGCGVTLTDWGHDINFNDNTEVK